jgi:hypothetical protein
MEEEHLRAVVRERVRTGELPSVFGGKTFGGRGSNGACDCCDQIITHHEIEYEVELSLPLDSSRLTFIAHPKCHWIWREESEPAEAVRQSRGGPLAGQLSGWMRK